MDEKVVTAIHELANALAGLGSWQQQLVSLAILLVVAAGGSFFGAYLKTRATNAAMSDDLDEIKKQLRETTATAETIKSRIGKDSELHSLRIRKLEELMQAFLETQNSYRALFQTLMTPEPAKVTADFSQHPQMLSRFYFPELAQPIDNFCARWWELLIDTKRDRAELLEHEDKDIIDLRLAQWKRDGFPQRDACEENGREVEERLVETMRLLLGEEGPEEAGHALE